MTLAELGALLREERLTLDQTVETLATRLKIPSRILRAIEDGNTQDVPHTVYTRGFIKGYGLELGFTNEKITALLDQLEGFDEDFSPPKTIENIPVADPSPKQAQPSSGKGRVLWVLVLAALIGGGYYYYRQMSAPRGDTAAPSSEAAQTSQSAARTGATSPATSPTPTTSAPTTGTSPANATSAPAANSTASTAVAATSTALASGATSGGTTSGPAANASGPAAQASASAPSSPAPSASSAAGATPVVASTTSGANEATPVGTQGFTPPGAMGQTPPASPATARPASLPAGMHQIVLTADADCWVHANADGTETREFTLKSGETFAMPFKKSLMLKLGNAGGVRIKYDGVEMPPAGAAGQVKTVTFPPQN